MDALTASSVSSSSRFRRLSEAATASSTMSGQAWLARLLRRPKRRCQAARGVAGKLLNKPPNPLESQLSQAAIKQVKYLLLKWPKHSQIYEAHYSQT